MNNFLRIYIFVAVVHLLSKLAGHTLTDQLTKPLLLPLLMLYFTQATSQHKSKLRLLFMAALFFSWLGDVVLMFSEVRELFFILGLFFFLLTQLFYATVFLAWIEKSSLTPVNMAAAIIPFTAFGVFLLIQLMPNLGSLFIPVVIYASAITLMGISASLTYTTLGLKQCSMFVCGCLFFIVSDSLLAINKFMEPVPYSGFWVMLTYIMAQAIITHSTTQVLTRKEQ